MKKVFIFLLLMFIAASCNAALTNGVGSVTRPTAYWWTGLTPAQPNGDIGLAWMKEVEAIIEGATLDNGNLLTFDNGGTISNVTDGSIILAEAGEDLKLAFSTDNVTVSSSTDVDELTFGTIVPAANQMLFTPVTAIVGTVEGTVYYDSDDDTLWLRDASGLVDLTAGASGVTDLDSAYNGGATIDVDGDAVTLTVSLGDNNPVAIFAQNDATNDPTAVQITSAADLANAISLDIDGQTTGRDIEGTGASWYVTGLGDLTANDIVASSIAVTTLFESALVAASSGNVALTIDAAGNGTITVGGTSTGEVTVVPVLNLTGALVANGPVTLGNAAADDITATGEFVSNIVLDDDTTDSPSVIFRDAGENDWIFLKANGATGNLTATSDAATSDFQIVTGNLKVGAGSEGVALNGEDAFITGTLEVNGAVQFDGAYVGNSTTTLNGDVAVNDEILVTLNAADEEVIITNSHSTITADQMVEFVMSAQTTSTYILALTATADANAQDDYLILADNSGANAKLTIGSGGTTTWTLDAAAIVQMDGDTTANTSTGGLLDINYQTATNTGKGLSITTQLEDGATQAYAVYLDVDDDTTGAEVIDLISVLNSAGTNATTRGLVVANTIDDAIVATLGAASQFAVVDAQATQSTVTTGLWDINAEFTEDTAAVINIDVESEANGAGEFVHGIYIQMDDDADNADNELHGITVTGDGTNGTGLQHGIVVLGANIDAGLKLDTGYLRVGTGATPDQTLGAADNAFIEGTLEVDGVVYADSGITGDGADAIAGFLQSITNDAEPHAITAAESGTVLTNAGSDGADAWTLPTAVAGYEYIFVVMAAQNMQITPAAGDSIIGSGTDVGAGDTYSANAVGETLHLIAVDGTNWIIISETGTWTDSVP